MDCKIISTRKSAAGVTLVEMLVATGISSIVLLAVCSLSYFGGRSFAAITNYVDLDNYSRKALDRMTKEIRQANVLTSASSTRLDFQDSDGATLTYYYNRDRQKLYRIKNGTFETLLEGCTQLSFSIYQRNPVGGTYDQFPTADPSNCKLVQLNWICSRQILGKTENTESVQSAKIVIRKG